MSLLVRYLPIICWRMWPEFPIFSPRIPIIVWPQNPTTSHFIAIKCFLVTKIVPPPPPKCKIFGDGVHYRWGSSDPFCTPNSSSPAPILVLFPRKKCHKNAKKFAFLMASKRQKTHHPSRRKRRRKMGNILGCVRSAKMRPIWALYNLQFLAQNNWS